MEEENDLPRWDELIPEALVLIFVKLPLKDKVSVIPSVCKSWRKVITGFDCWLQIDFEGVANDLTEEAFNELLQMLLRRSSGQLQSLRCEYLPGDQSLSLIADHAQSLSILKLPRSAISNSLVEQVACRLSTLIHLDLSYCEYIGAPALEAFGNNCKHLAYLNRTIDEYTFDYSSQDDEAFAIAATMPKLKQLKISRMRIGTEAVLKILAGCPELELLNISGCYGLEIDDKFLEKFQGLKVIKPGLHRVFRRTIMIICPDGIFISRILVIEPCSLSCRKLPFLLLKM